MEDPYGDLVGMRLPHDLHRCLGEYMLGPGHAKTQPMGHEIEELQGQRTIWTIVHNWVLFLLVLF
jgi:hypothetical protein